MLPQYGANHTGYYAKLVELKPLIETLTNMTQVIWLTPLPTSEFVGTTNSRDAVIYEPKLQQYTRMIKKALRYYISAPALICLDNSIV